MSEHSCRAATRLKMAEKRRFADLPLARFLPVITAEGLSADPETFGFMFATVVAFLDESWCAAGIKLEAKQLMQRRKSI